MMATPLADAPVTRDHRCQTDRCPNDFAVITIRVDTSDIMLLCEGCNLAFNMAVLTQMHDKGLISLGGPVT